MTFLTAVIITFNEEENILRCINSARQVADEIVVVDSYSTDDTKRICSEQGVRFVESAFKGYGYQKNFAVAQASFDHVLNLDADEYLSEDLAASIRREKEGGFPHDAYVMNRLNRYCGQWIRHGCWYPDRKLRLFNRQKGQWSGRLVHEHVEIQPGVKPFHLPGDLYHIAYDRVEQHLAKNEAYSALSAREMFDHGKRTNALNLVFKPVWAFVNCYLIRLGFLDGRYGYIIARNAALITYGKNKKLMELWKQHRKAR